MYQPRPFSPSVQFEFDGTRFSLEPIQDHMKSNENDRFLAKKPCDTPTPNPIKPHSKKRVREIQDQLISSEESNASRIDRILCFDREKKRRAPAETGELLKKSDSLLPQPGCGLESEHCTKFWQQLRFLFRTQWEVRASEAACFPFAARESWW